MHREASTPPEQNQAVPFVAAEVCRPSYFFDCSSVVGHLTMPDFPVNFNHPRGCRTGAKCFHRQKLSEGGALAGSQDLA